MNTTSSRPLASYLTGREYVRVMKVTNARLPRDPNRTKSEQLAKYWVTARELYPAKVPS